MSALLIRETLAKSLNFRESILELLLGGWFRRYCRRFTSCYDHTSTQVEIFDRDVLPLLNVLYRGIVS